MAVRLVPITKENVRDVMRLKVAPHQNGFVADNAVSLAQAYSEYATAWPRAIADDDTLVGFLMIDKTPDPDPKYAGCTYLWRFMIGADHQKKGYGAAAMAALIEEISTWPGIHSLILSYVPGEHGPEHFYKKLGFTETGDRVDNSDELVMIRPLRAAAEG